MQVNAYINFNGNCREALEFYERCLGAKIIMLRTHAGSPMDEKTPAAWKEKILHARLHVGESVIMASDSPPEYFKAQEGFYLSLQLDDTEKAERIFLELAKDGAIHMPLQETFWAKRFGMLRDRFGIPWMLNCDLKE